MRFSIYLAGKIPKGEEVDGFQDWREIIRGLFEEKRKSFSKVSKIVYLGPHTLEADKLPKVEDFFGRDVHLIAMCDAVFVDARGKIGAGTAQEMLIAKYFKKPVVTVIPRESHYWKKRTLLHGKEIEYRHPFLFSTSDLVVEDFGQAVVWLLRYFSGEIKPEIKGIGILDKSQKQYLESHLKNDEFVQGWKKEMEGLG